MVLGFILPESHIPLATWFFMSVEAHLLRGFIPTLSHHILEIMHITFLCHSFFVTAVWDVQWFCDLLFCKSNLVGQFTSLLNRRHCYHQVYRSYISKWIHYKNISGKHGWCLNKNSSCSQWTEVTPWCTLTALYWNSEIMDIFLLAERGTAVHADHWSEDWIEWK